MELPTAKLQPNTTQIPNIILDEWMSELTPAEFKVVMTIVRQTYGWHKETDRISYSQLVEKTGYTKDTLTIAVKSLRTSGKIIVTDSEGTQLHTVDECRGKSLYYKLNLEYVGKSDMIDEKVSEIPSRKIRHTKETYTKALSKDNGRVTKKLPSCPLLNGSPLKAKYPNGHQECTEYLISEEEDRNCKFINRPKQFSAIHKILRAGYDFQVMDRTIREVEKKYGKGAWDYATLANWIEKGAGHA